MYLKHPAAILLATVGFDILLVRGPSLQLKVGRTRILNV